MLVLSRKIGEQLVATMPDGRTMTITVCRVAGNRVTLGLNAPADVQIVRQELPPRTTPEPQGAAI